MNKSKYTKFRDCKGRYHYEVTLPNGSTHFVRKELGDYLHSLESNQVKHHAFITATAKQRFK